MCQMYVVYILSQNYPFVKALFWIISLLFFVIVIADLPLLWLNMNKICQNKVIQDKFSFEIKDK